MTDKKAAPDSGGFESIIPKELEDQLVAQYGKGLKAVRTAAGPVVLRRVSRSDYKRFRSMLFNEKTRAEAGDWLVQAARVHPDAKQLLAMLDEYPGISTKLSAVAMELVGTDEDAEEKALGT